MIDQKLVQQDLSRKGRVRFGFNMTQEKYKRFVQKVIDEYGRGIASSISGEDVFEDYEISPEIQRKVKAQVAKAMIELKKVVDMIR